MESQLIELLKKGKIAVMPTDTIYGIVGSALDPIVVEKIYKLRQRSTDKPMIILVYSLDDLEKFDIKLSSKQKEFLEKNWPNPLSVVLPMKGEKFKYLHRGKNALAFRIPKDQKVLELLKQTGPLVAPSANFEGEKPGETINDVRKYFRDEVFYIDGGKIKSKPSTLIQLSLDGSVKLLRQGSYKLV